MAANADPDEPLKRLGGGRWQTRDARFTIEPQSGTWVVVDAEQTDDLGLPLVRGPFGSLGAAKTAIAGARSSEPATSPLPARAEWIQGASSTRARTKATAAPATRCTRGSSATRGTPPKPTAPARPPKPAEPVEPRWITDLDPEDRKRARRLVKQLTDASARDPEGIARRDIVGQVPAAAAFAVVRRILALGPAASPSAVARILVDGRDDDLGARWRLVDGEGRPITLDLDALQPSPDP
jgi:hypothetical protein